MVANVLGGTSNLVAYTASSPLPLDGSLFTATNTEVIYRVNNKAWESYVPGRTINDFTELNRNNETGRGYIIVAKQDIEVPGIIPVTTNIGNLPTTNRLSEYNFVSGTGQQLVDASGNYTSTGFRGFGTTDDQPQRITGKGFSFGGNGDITVDTRAFFDQTVKSFTLFVVFKQTDATKGGLINHPAFSLTILTSSLSARIKFNDGSFTENAARSTPINNTYCYAVRYSSGVDCSAFINNNTPGNPVTVEKAWTIPVSQPIKVFTDTVSGSSIGLSDYATFQGEIYYIASYKEALTDAEIQNRMAILNSLISPRGFFF